MSQIPKILVDNCVLSTGYADPARWVRIGNDPRKNRPLLYEVKKYDSKRRATIVANIAIGKYAKSGNVDLYMYSELLWEEWQGYHSMRGNLSPLAAFQNVNFQEVPSPLERSKLFQSANWVEGSEVEKFIDFLLEVDIPSFLKTMNKIGCFSDFEIRNVKKLHEFRSLCSEKALGRTRARDAFHLWAAECNDIDYFLTTDLKFVRTFNNATSHGNINTKCKTITPESLIKELGISVEGVDIPDPGKMFWMSGQEYRE